MHLYSFFNDYSEGAHPSIFAVLEQTNLDQYAGYGEDSLADEAKKLIQKHIQFPDAAIHFVTAGTQANFITLAAMLKPYESVVAVESAHINVHEAGAVEATGHKIHAVKGVNGKITIPEIQQVLDFNHDEHMAKPKVVFISHATELGTIYSRQELTELSAYCREKSLYLYLDGARLGSALCSSEADLTLADIAKLVDAFYIGGTKNGAFLGEAIVICNKELQENFRYILKQRGALLAKGRLLSAQFIALFQHDLYFQLARHANAMAGKMTKHIESLGFPFLTPSATNQIFPILPDTLIARLEKLYGFYVWSRIDTQHSAIRLVTSWATPEEMVDRFLEDLAKSSQDVSFSS